MFNCPVCGSEVKADRAKCHCGTDLSFLIRIDCLADAWFNQALLELDRGFPGRALEWLSACCIAQPSDVDARIALSKVWTQLGCLDEALDSLKRVEQLAPDRKEVEDIRECIKTLSQDQKKNASRKRKRISIDSSEPAKGR